MKKLKKYFKDSWKTLISSFKEFDLRVIFIVLYDLLFYSLVIIGAFIFGKYMQKKTMEISNVPIDRIMDVGQSELTKIASQLKGFLFSLIVSIVVVILIAFIAMVITKSLIWLTVAKKKVKIDFIKKFALLNLIWFSIWLIPIAVSFILLKKELIAPAIIIILILMFYFTNLVHISFTKKQKISSIKTGIKLGTKKIHLLILPYMMIGVLFFIVSQLYWVYNLFPETLKMVVSVLILLTFMAWYRIYLYKVIEIINP